MGDILDRIPKGYTPGPWRRVGWKPCGIYGPGGLGDAERLAAIDCRAAHDANAALMALAPELAAEVIRLRAILGAEGIMIQAIPAGEPL